MRRPGPAKTSKRLSEIDVFQNQEQAGRATWRFGSQAGSVSPDGRAGMPVDERCMQAVEDRKGQDERDAGPFDKAGHGGCSHCEKPERIIRHDQRLS
jgi:hypothetical protein